MKKIIITVMAIIMMMSLVSCGEEPTKPVLSLDGVETIETETIETENVEQEEYSGRDITFEGVVYENVSQKVFGYMNAYLAGDISKEAMEEILFNSQSNDF